MHCPCQAHPIRQHILKQPAHPPLHHIRRLTHAPGATQGYSTGNPEARFRGALSYFGLFTLVGATIRFAWQLISSK